MADRIDYLTNCIENNIPVVFCKYGDGEFYCSAKYSKNIPHTQNCDNDTYTVKLSESLTNAFKYITNQDNTFIGRWFNIDVIKYWESLTPKQINWTNYHTLLFNLNELQHDDEFIHKSKIYKAIKKSKLKKIIICNELLVKTELLLNLDHIVIIPLQNWFDEKFTDILNQVRDLIGEEQNSIVLTACGMSAKVLIAELHKSHPKCIYLDIGSGLDCICTKRNSRGGTYIYDLFYNKFKEHNLLTENWDDPKYDFIYEQAYNKLGTHLPK